MQLTIQHEDGPTEGGFYLRADDPTADPLGELTYRWDDGVMTILHTGVRPVLRGQGQARRLVEAAIAKAREDGFRIRPVCSYAARVFQDQGDTLGDVHAV